MLPSPAHSSELGSKSLVILVDYYPRMKVTGVKVLILETDEAVVSGLEKICRHFSAEFRVVNGIGQFRVEVTRFRPQMILIGEGGNRQDLLKLIRDLRNYGPTQFIPIYSVVSRGDQSSLAHFLEAGSDDYLDKPLDYRALKFRFYSFLFHASKVHVMRRVSQEWKARYESARTANDAKTRFLANMSHDIRTPLSGVIGMTSFLLETDLRAEQKNFVETIRTSGEVALSILEDILDFSKIESGKLELYCQPMYLSHCFEEALDSVMPRAAEKDLNINFSLDPSLSDSVFGDRKRIRQVFTNLVGNAVKFTSHGDVFIKGENAGSRDGKTWYRFSVTDTGIGIDQEHLQNLFEYFRQASVFIGNQYGGYGLGLAISKGLVNLMDGAIWVESKAGKGSTFYFELPLEVCASMKVEESRPLLEHCRELSGRRLLLVDTFLPRRNALPGMLKGWGLEVTVASSIEECRKMLISAEKPFDYVLLHNHDHSEYLDQGVRSLCSEINNRALPARIVASIPYQSTWQKTREHEGLPVSWVPRPLKYSMLRSTLVQLREAGSSRSAVTASGDHKPSAGTASRDQSADPSSSEAAPARLADRLPLNILLVDDNHINLKVAGQLVKQLGYEHYEIAENGQEAIDKCREHDFDFVLMDVQMPVVDGLEATRQIRDDEVINGRFPARIVAMTANVMADDRSNCLKAGMDEYLSKPIRSNTLRQTIEKLFLKESDGPSQQSPSESAPQRPGRQPCTTDEARSKSPEAAPAAAAGSGSSSLVSQFEHDLGNLDQPLESTNAIHQMDRNQAREQGGYQKGGTGIVDLAHLEEISGRDRDIMRDIASQYLKDATDRVRQLRSAVKIEDFEKARRICHNFAGASATCGVLGVEKLLRQMEHMCRNRHLPNGEQVFNELDCEVDRVGKFFTEKDFVD